MLLKYISSLAPHFFTGPDMAPHFLHARNATAFYFILQWTFALLMLLSKLLILKWHISPDGESSASKQLDL